MARATLASKTYEKLKSHIRDGDFGPGEPITEARVAEILGVGRGPIREALVRLEFEGLIHRPGPHQSRRLRQLEDFHPAQRRHEYEMREALDGLAARSAALNMTGQQILALRDVMNRITQAIVKQDSHARAVALDDFYTILRTQCGNPLIAKAYAACGIQTFQVRTPEIDAKLVERIPYHEYPVPTLDRVVEAIALHQPELAEAEMRDWTRRVREILDDLFAEPAE